MIIIEGDTEAEGGYIQSSRTVTESLKRIELDFGLISTKDVININDSDLSKIPSRQTLIQLKWNIYRLCDPVKENAVSRYWIEMSIVPNIAKIDPQTSLGSVD